MNTKRPFWKTFRYVTILFLLVVAIYFVFITDATFGINKTVGWAWDITNGLFWAGVLQAIVIVFLILYIVTSLIVKLRRLF